MTRSSLHRFGPTVLAVAMLTACNGRVKMDGIEGFGLVWSAVWMVDADDEDDQSLWLSNVTGLCRKAQKAAVETEEFFDDYDELDHDEDDEDCEFYETAYSRLAQIYKPLYPKNAHYLSMGVRGDRQGATEFDEGTWEVGDQEHLLHGNVSYFNAGGYFQLIADEIDCEDDDDWREAYDDANDDFEDDNDLWYFDEGTELDITSARSGKTLKGAFGGDLLDMDGDEDGNVQGKFNASWCEIEEEGYLSLY